MGILTINDKLTLLERMHRNSENADAARIIEALSQTNSILQDAPAIEANERTVHTSVVRTALAHGTHRIYNQGIQTSASQTKVVHDVVCELAGYSYADKKLVDEAANPTEFLNGEVSSFIEGMGQDQAEDFVYGNHGADSAYMDGFAIRRPKIDEKLCIDMGGTTTGKLTSVYIVKWARDKAHVIFPKGASGCGVSRVDKGVQTVDAPSGGKMEAYVNYFTASYGLAVRNDKSLIRLANIDTATTKADDVIKTILKASHNLAIGDGTICIYGNADVLSLLDVATVDKSNVCYTDKDPWGNELLKIRTMRLRQVDAILSTEDKIA